MNVKRKEKGSLMQFIKKKNELEKRVDKEVIIENSNVQKHESKRAVIRSVRNVTLISKNCQWKKKTLSGRKK